MIWALLPAYGATIHVEGAPTVDQPAVLFVEENGEPAEAVTVSVVYRPGLPGEGELAIGVTDNRGRVRWQPDRPGVAQLKAGNGSLRVSVPWQAPPSETALLLVLLVFTSALGVGFGVRRA